MYESPVYLCVCVSFFVLFLQVSDWDEQVENGSFPGLAKQQ